MDMGYARLRRRPRARATWHDADGAHGRGTWPAWTSGGSVSVGGSHDATPIGRRTSSVDLTARAGAIELASGREVDGYTLNGSSPGPRSRRPGGRPGRGHLRNESVPDGVTLHWHGVDVPNAEDGVAGVTQDAVEEGEEYTYRFVADQVGTYWYHSHQVSHEQVRRGLLGPLVVEPRRGIEQDVDVVALPTPTPGPGRSTAQEGVVRVDGRSRRHRAGPRHEHRQRPDRSCGRTRTLPGARHRRVRRARARDRSTVDRSPSDRRGPRRPRGDGARTTAQRPGVQVGGFGTVTVRARGSPRSHAAAAAPADELDLLSYGEPRRPLRLRHRHLRPRHCRSSFELRHRAPARLPRRQARPVVDDQRPPLPRRPDVRGRGGRRGS